MTTTDDRQQWLDWRRGGIGGSDVAAIVGLSPWRSAYSVWADKVGLTTDDTDSPAMEFGRRAEPMLAAWFADKTGMEVVGQQQRVQHPLNPWMLCTVDGMTPDGHVVEFKTTSEPEWAEVPAHYRCQAQWNMACTGAEGCWFGVLHIAYGRPRFEPYYIERDTADVEFLTATVERFWRHHVLEGDPPPVDGHESTTATLNGLWDEADGALEATDDVRQWAAERAHARAEAERWHEVAEAAENRIRQAMGDHDRITDGKRNLATWRWQERARVDLDALREAAPDLVAAHTTTTRSRVLRVNHKE